MTASEACNVLYALMLERCPDSQARDELDGALLRPVGVESDDEQETARALLREVLR